MSGWFEGVFGSGALAAQFVAILLALILVTGLVALVARQFRGDARSRQPGSGRQPRIAILEVAVVDDRRRLLLVRRDQVEHLVMIGGPSDFVVESGIVRSAPGVRPLRPVAAAEPQPAASAAASGRAAQRMPADAPAAPAARAAQPPRPSRPETAGTTPAAAALAAGAAALTAAAARGGTRRNGRDAVAAGEPETAGDAVALQDADDHDAPNALEATLVSTEAVAIRAAPVEAAAVADLTRPAEASPGAASAPDAETAARPAQPRDGRDHAAAHAPPQSVNTSSRQEAKPRDAAITIPGSEPRQEPVRLDVPARAAEPQPAAPTPAAVEAPPVVRPPSRAPADAATGDRPAIPPALSIRSAPTKPFPAVASAERGGPAPDVTPIRASGPALTPPRPEIAPAAGIGVMSRTAAETPSGRPAPDRTASVEPRDAPTRASSTTLGDLAARLEAALSQQAAARRPSGPVPADERTDAPAFPEAPATPTTTGARQAAAVQAVAIEAEPSGTPAQAPAQRRSAFDSLEDEMARLLGELTGGAEQRRR